MQEHISVAVLAFLLERILEKKLKAARIGLSGKAALEALHAAHVVKMKVGSEQKQGIIDSHHRAHQVR